MYSKTLKPNGTKKHLPMSSMRGTRLNYNVQNATALKL